MGASQSSDSEIAAGTTWSAIEAFVNWLRASQECDDFTSLPMVISDLPTEINGALQRLGYLVALQTSLPADIVSQSLWGKILLELSDESLIRNSRSRQLN